MMMLPREWPMKLWDRPAHECGRGGPAAVLGCEGARHPPPRLGGSGQENGRCQPTLPGLPASGHSELGTGTSGTTSLLPSVVRREVRACGRAPLGNESCPCPVSCLRPPGGPGLHRMKPHFPGLADKAAGDLTSDSLCDLMHHTSSFQVYGVARCRPAPRFTPPAPQLQSHCDSHI